MPTTPDENVMQYMSSGLQAIATLDNVYFDTNSVRTDSPSEAEDLLSRRDGVDPVTDIVSIPGTRLHLRMKLYAVREHLLGALYLIGSQAERTPANPIEVLARSAMEGSAISLWLCNNHICWDERLRRHSQLHLNSTYTSLREAGIDPSHASNLSERHPAIEETVAECNTIIEWVIGRGWTCRKGKNKGKPPTPARWVKELPSFTEIIQSAADFLPIDPELLRVRYSISSRSVHTDPVTVADDSSEEHERMRVFRALSATSTAIMFYALAWNLVAGWSGVPYPEDDIKRQLTALDDSVPSV